jgi:hypothetical protein
MPVHDWTRVDAGLLHNFHQSWIIALRNALNDARLPGDYFAYAELSTRGVDLIHSSDQRIYLREAHRVAVRDQLGAIAAVIEIVSPSNKASRHALHSFVKKSAALMEQGVHVLVVDPFPPSRFDPNGIHKAIWEEFTEDEYSPPPGKPFTVAAYDAGPPVVSYVESFAVGDALPDMPLFLKPEVYVPTPLELTYLESWIILPTSVKRLFDPRG